MFELFPRLKEREKQKAGTLSGGEQQMLAIGRALMADPKLLLLDEPSMGLAPLLVERIYETIAEINEQGTTILLVEQNANFALDVSQARLRARDRARSRWPTRPRSCARTPRCRRRTWAHDRRSRGHRREGAVPHVRVAGSAIVPRGCPIARATARSRAWRPGCCSASWASSSGSSGPRGPTRAGRCRDRSAAARGPWPRCEPSSARATPRAPERRAAADSRHPRAARGVAAAVDPAARCRRATAAVAQDRRGRGTRARDRGGHRRAGRAGHR